MGLLVLKPRKSWENWDKLVIPGLDYRYKCVNIQLIKATWEIRLYCPDSKWTKEELSKVSSEEVEKGSTEDNKKESPVK